MGSEKSTTKRLREIFELLLRTMKTQSLYEAANPVSEKLETELHARLTSILDEEGALEFNVLQHRILFEDEVVYESREPQESLAFLLSRDGIRNLVFRPGLEREELGGFVSCLNRERVLVGGEDDLTTLFWEEDFQSIDYLVIDELADEPAGEHLGEGLIGAGWLGGSAQARGAGRADDTVQLEDLRPSAHLPVADACLSQSETAALRRELADESAADPFRLAVELAVELVMLEPELRHRQDLECALAGVLAELVVQSRADDFLDTFEYLERLTGEAFAAEKGVGELFAGVCHALAREEPLSRFLGVVEQQPMLAERAEHFLKRLPEVAVSTLVGRLGRARQSRWRRAVSDALLVHGDSGPKMLMDRLPALLAAGESPVVEELLYMVRQLPPDAARPLVERLLRSGWLELTRRGVLMLGRYRGEWVERLLFDLLDSDDSEISSLALGGLVHTGNAELAPRLLQRALTVEHRAMDPEERKRTVVAVGRLGRDSILPALERLVEAHGDVRFPRREEKEVLQAVVHGVRAVGSSASRAYLEKLAGGRSRFLRDACREALAAGQR
ncbi:MAG: hypothetical protein ACE5GX_15500 [Thermoanaerobaculia bacterium]